MQNAITATGLSKKYHIGSRRSSSFRETLAGSFRKLSQRSAEKSSEFWALKNVSFDVKPGEVVGIIGKNGAGKSTLLKILSRITPPTEGRAEINGRIASLLEVGTGFHPELTGRENIYMNGVILGMRRQEIKNKFDEIVAFSGIEPFIDTPVKRYSSGMYVRLAFAVAAHLEPEILIVDEVLAVGDAEFQKKCLGKMKDVSEQEGRTVLFVSHNMQALSVLTKSTMVLEHGEIGFHGDTKNAITYYFDNLWKQEAVYKNEAASSHPSVTQAEVITSEANNLQLHGKPLAVKFRIHVPHEQRGLALSFQVINNMNIPVLHIWHFDTELNECHEKGDYEWTCTIPNLRLYMGRYHLKIYLSETSSKVLFETIDLVCPFEVSMMGVPRDFPWENDACIYLEDANWNTVLLERSYSHS